MNTVHTWFDAYRNNTIISPRAQLMTLTYVRKQRFRVFTRTLLYYQVQGMIY